MDNAEESQRDSHRVTIKYTRQPDNSIIVEAFDSSGKLIEYAWGNDETQALRDLQGKMEARGYTQEDGDWTSS